MSELLAVSQGFYTLKNGIVEAFEEVLQGKLKAAEDL